jgi:hypothetical protein
MPGKIIWLTMAITIAYWLGSAGGCASTATQENQNYKTLEKDRQQFETKHDTDKPGASVTPDSPAAELAATETGPSLKGLDRSHWPVLVTQSDVGTSQHQPHYFQDLEITPVNGYGDSPLDGQDSAGLDKTNTVALLAQPLKFAADLVLLPVSVLADPPCLCPVACQK